MASRIGKLSREDLRKEKLITIIRLEGILLNTLYLIIAIAAWFVSNPYLHFIRISNAPSGSTQLKKINENNIKI